MCVTGNPYTQEEAASDQLLRSDRLYSEIYCCIVDNDHPLHGTATLDQLFEFPHVLAQFAGVTMQTTELKARIGRNSSHPTINCAELSRYPELRLRDQIDRYPAEPNVGGGAGAVHFAQTRSCV